MRPHTRAHGESGVVADDRGAIMVMGIFMCVILVGGLWYIAGIGDALIFRERMQEAADSVAFSAAVIQARGMNIIVMINLIMAAILAIRVVVNMVKAVVTVVAAAFAVIAAIEPFGAWAIPIATGLGEFLEDLQSFESDVLNPAVDDALQALNTAWHAIADATPAAAIAGAEEMQSKYPVTMVPGVFSSGLPPSTFTLPVTDDSLDKLCTEADSDVGNLISDVVPGPIGTMLGGALTAVLNMAPSYFCGLPGGSSTPPDLSSLTNAACGNANGQACGQADAATQNYNQLVAQDASASAIASAQAQMNGYDKACNTAQSNCSDAGSSASSSLGSNTSSGGGDEAPAAVNSSWYDGCAAAQIMSGLLSDSSSQSRVGVSPKFVSIAGRGKVTMNGPDITKGQTASWAQAEFFYDQGGDWGTMSPNAMWNFYWRARFRLSNPNALTGGDAALIAGYADAASLRWGAAVLADGAKGITGTNFYTGVAKAGIVSAISTTGTNGPTVH
jgi:hypothetical protein